MRHRTREGAEVHARHLEVANKEQLFMWSGYHADDVIIGTSVDYRESGRSSTTHNGSPPSTAPSDTPGGERCALIAAWSASLSNSSGYVEPTRRVLHIGDPAR